ncbi:hypothetical protein J4420_03745 [Candidatus Woesearchaeota archaeon]|nr:hypothetical protein [Candidatus Woesearchaeota archaeon]
MTNHNYLNNQIAVLVDGKSWRLGVDVSQLDEIVSSYGTMKIKEVIFDSIPTHDTLDEFWDKGYKATIIPSGEELTNYLTEAGIKFASDGKYHDIQLIALVSEDETLAPILHRAHQEVKHTLVVGYHLSQELIDAADDTHTLIKSELTKRLPQLFIVDKKDYFLSLSGHFAEDEQKLLPLLKEKREPGVSGEMLQILDFDLYYEEFSWDSE